jgi:hypothetical protein
MDKFGGIATLVIGGALYLATLEMRRRGIAGPPVDLLAAAAGAIVGTGGLLVQHDVGLASWVLTPIVVAALGIVHGRALFAGAGPLRI